MLQRLSLICLLWATSTVAQSAETAREWLDRMSSALQNDHFQYSLVQMQRDQIRTLRYVHGVVDDKEIAYLEHLNGPSKSVVRVGEQVTYLEHDVAPYSVRSLRIHGLLPNAFSSDIGTLSPHYQFVEGGRNRVAGRVAQLIRISPIDDYRYQYHLWLDQESALPLKVDLIDHENNLLEQLLVVELHRFEQPMPILRELNEQSWPKVVDTPHTADNDRWRFGWLPKGFSVTHYDQHLLLGLNEPVEYLALSDGLADFSVYIGRIGQVELPSHLSASNGLSLASAVHGDAEVVVVGKLPVDTLANVAQNLYPASQSGNAGEAEQGD